MNKLTVLCFVNCSYELIVKFSFVESIFLNVTQKVYEHILSCSCDACYIYKDPIHSNNAISVKDNVVLYFPCLEDVLCALAIQGDYDLRCAVWTRRDNYIREI